MEKPKFTKKQDQMLQAYALRKAKELHPDFFKKSDWLQGTPEYREDTSPYAIDGDAWLKAGVSYIWKVGVIALIDPNKCDWVYLLVFHHREPLYVPEFIGELHWRGGENDDIGRCLRRAIELATFIHPVFYGK